MAPRHGASRKARPVPAEWLTAEEASMVSDLLRRSENMIHPLPPAAEVSRQNEEINDLLFGELLTLLANSGVWLPQYYVTPYGIYTLVSSRDAPKVTEAIERFMNEASDETLADRDSQSGVILYAGRPELMRAGLAYMLKALKLPRQYDAVLFGAR